MCVATCNNTGRAIIGIPTHDKHVWHNTEPGAWYGRLWRGFEGS